MKFTLLSSLFLSTLALLSGCGSGVEDLSLNPGPITGAPNKGVFINRVAGLEYTRTFVPVAQLTTKDSTYDYRTGEPIMFHIGNLEIGEALGLNILTPKEIVSYKNLDLNTSIYSSEVNNRVRLLMSLDSNATKNGIQISQETLIKAQNWKTPNYTLSDTEFDNNVSLATGNELRITVTKGEAEIQFARELRCVYSGAYSGHYVLENGERSGFVGVMIQSSNTVDSTSSLGTIVALGDGQDLNGDQKYDEYLFARGTHNMDTGSYIFNETGEFKNGGIIPSDQNVSGDGESINYDNVIGSFKQIIDGKTQLGSYEATRVGQGQNAAYRYTGFGYENNTSTDTPMDPNDPRKIHDPVRGLFTFEINVDGNITGLIHDANEKIEAPLSGDMNFTTKSVHMTLKYPDKDSIKGLTYDINGTITTLGGNVRLTWYDKNTSNKLGFLDGVGCQLQPHN